MVILVATRGRWRISPNQVMVPTKKRNTKRKARQHNTIDESKNKGECKETTEDSIRIDDEVVPKDHAHLWFSLLPANDMNGERFPQLVKPSIRIKDYGATVSTLQKYLKLKLNLEDETKVEISCCGKKLNPKMNLHGIKNVWLECLLPNGLEEMRKKWAVEELLIELTYNIA